MPSLGGMQLPQSYKDNLSNDFLRWYPFHFTNNRMFYVHWTAVDYRTNFQEYHKVVLGDGTLINNADVDVDMFAHTYHRNSNACAIAAAAMKDGVTNSLGAFPPTVQQLKQMVVAVADSCTNHAIPVGNIMTHAEAADNKDFAQANDPDAPHDPYGPEHTAERWDFWIHIKPDTLQIQHAARVSGATAPPPDGFEYFPDWFRGQVMIGIQERTRRLWDPTTPHVH